ncbi:MAG: LysM peptidoglycan-binding domain-containing protein [Nitrososphaerales archaeon]
MRKRLLLVACILVVVLALALPASASAASSDATAAPQGGGFWYLVKRGDTLASIAHKFGVSVDGLAAVNGLTSINRIWAGTYLWIPAATVPPTFPPGQTCRTKYTVKRGDTLAKIANYFGVTVWRLAWNNGIKNYNRIYPGQRLCIPWAGIPQ